MAKGKKRKVAPGDVASNRLASHKYEFLDKLEAGLVLQGTEVKALRESGASLKDGFAMIREGEVWMWTYRVSQKVRNLERDPRATLLVEAGETYDQLRGVMTEAEAEVVDDYDAVLDLGRELGGRYAPGAAGPEAEQALAHQAGKRVAIRFHPRRVVSWDHRKL